MSKRQLGVRPKLAGPRGRPAFLQARSHEAAHREVPKERRKRGEHPEAVRSRERLSTLQSGVKPPGAAAHRERDQRKEQASHPQPERPRKDGQRMPERSFQLPDTMADRDRPVGKLPADLGRSG